MAPYRDDDYASMLEALEGRLSRRQIAQALRVKERVVDEIAVGSVPQGKVAERLRVLASLAGDADEADPQAVARVLGIPPGEARRLSLSAAALLAQRRTVIVAVVLVDLLVFGLVTLVLGVR
jgi:hypothetical protein